MVVYPLHGAPVMALAAMISLACAAGAADAQSTAANAATANGAYARANLPAEAQVRDAAGAAVATDGVIQAGQDESSLGRTGGGSLDTVSGVSSSSDATQVGANLKVVTTGQSASSSGSTASSSTSASQTNADNASAQASTGETTSLSGGVSDDPPH
jgi:hypothetical protein